MARDCRSKNIVLRPQINVIEGGPLDNGDTSEEIQLIYNLPFKDELEDSLEDDAFELEFNQEVQRYYYRDSNSP